MSIVSMNSPLGLACTAGAAEFVFKVLNIARVNRKWDLVGQQLDIWIDYPQAIAAGFVALSFFGRGVVGYSAAAVLMITPLALKVCREIQFADPMDYNDYTDVNMREAEVILGHVVKIINMSAAIRATWSEPQNFTHIGQAVALTLFLSARIWQCFDTGH